MYTNISTFHCHLYKQIIELQMFPLFVNQILGFQWLLLFVIVVSCGCLGLNFNDYVVLNSGHKLPLRGFGTSNLKAKPFQVKEAVYQALQIGYR